MNRFLASFLTFFITASSTWWIAASFTAVQTRLPSQCIGYDVEQTKTVLFMSSNDDDSDLIARKIIVSGDVQGGYYRSCVANEAGRFRRLFGTMSPPDDSDEAEIYVEGKSKTVEGFIRWLKRGNAGLSVVTDVKEVLEEEPTGLFDGFYVKTK